MKISTLDGKTPDIAEKNIQMLKQIFPEVFSEGKVDFDKLKQVLGDYVEDSTERYNFTWNGKGQALRLSQSPSLGTLRPCKEESKDWDTTQNLYIEGDNLEVLKLLQKSYHGKIKMIYIDPPYNTGEDFVYPDNFHDSIENYKKITGQVDDEGKKIGTNTETSGRYHTNWLNMMYPRLRLARNLLADDGVIFVSVDYNENFNCRTILNEIFGLSNFIGEIYWESKTKSQNTETAYNKLQPKAEMILVYTKQLKRRFNLIVKELKDYPLSDEQGNYREYPLEVMNATGIRGRETMIYDVSDGISTVSPPPGKQWKLGQDQVAAYKDSGNLFIREGKVIIKMRPEFERNETTEPFWGFFSKELGTAENAKSDLTELIGEHGFETVKPIDVIKRLIFHATEKNDIILDFFSGSATTAHAVMQLNADDGDSGKRKFIMVQLPELTDKKSTTYKAGYVNVSEIGKERIRRAGEKIKSEAGLFAQNLDVGFKVFKLDTSNIRKWQPDYDNLEVSLLDYVDNFVEGRTELDVVYEIMLKYGFDLTYSVDEFIVSEKKVYSVGYGMLMICLSNGIKPDVAEGILKRVKELSPESSRVVFKDNGFEKDSDKTNIKEILKVGGIKEFITI
ncbi:MAG TPA: DNA methyltransferase [Clostridia bacterium]|jgi:adenine-specific DNA-methyltransferase|nr:DNA methyltransferase [Clostridia bacterium]HQH66498.1 DNA methyltransferase [Clostridia bacterium]HQJ93103.1 DNA methyltransferase [Clostridia bacterium]HRU59771.1 DNA methyltransferase [Clostridia bacterium]